MRGSVSRNVVEGTDLRLGRRIEPDLVDLDPDAKNRFQLVRGIECGEGCRRVTTRPFSTKDGLDYFT